MAKFSCEVINIILGVQLISPIKSMDVNPFKSISKNSKSGYNKLIISLASSKVEASPTNSICGNCSNTFL
jgi:hypothetical protein